MMLLGRISYMQYLLQRLVWSMFCKNVPDSARHCFIYPFVLILAAYVLQRWYESVFTQWQTQQLKGEDGIDIRLIRWLDLASERCKTISFAAVVVLEVSLTVALLMFYLLKS